MLFRWIYTFLISLVAPILLYSLYKKRPGKPTFGTRWKEHFGLTPKLTDQSENPPIWIHAVSVGESLAAIPLIKALKQANPNQTIVVTTTTSTGAEQIARLGDLVEHRYMPIDLPFCINGFLKKIKPQKLLIIETELWPNTLHYVHKQQIPIAIINARLSQKSADNYQKIHSLFRQITRNIDHLLCLHKEDEDRFLRLGVPQNKLTVTGSIKFDIDISEEVMKSGHILRQQLGAERPVWVAASTHEGEDKQVLSAFKTILQQHSHALLILIPRHPERFNDVFQLSVEYGFNTVRRTIENSPEQLKQSQVYLGDTMGEMLKLIAAADITFMAGSLIGEKVGGHNMLEPAALAKPIITGPSFFNFKDITQQLQTAGALMVINDSQQLATEISSLFKHPERQNSMGVAGLSVVNKNQGAVAKTITAIQQLQVTTK
ncbi:lipid IV(A) 3-deoxy-D-manno-octulosonic acid transferase [Vibrio sp. SS-MA-C1-2]|uniref:lipid IV(A) 3-deoxy-D-manno-octulosonic acid transferase n=1 Tax=Vibrio sp. SS-MA-C1-2 TaxID=2908646 RepID=UPI001EFFD4A0|nr:lipid IV(A) 3-deoxy-D-manno-octulosonic acid transferase [Vibrio sp. SS-MA-C1-2]UJF19261.1 lipid IV(A) 3-deoxy-D-manno-octulosonic acid transferase [Vibrio sp. SS-MA-C1-2]